MESLAPWLAVAAVGALHGLNPATGWMLVAASGLRSSGPGRQGTTGRAGRVLVPIALGHVASLALVAALVALGIVADRSVLQVLAGTLLAAGVAVHLWQRTRLRAQSLAGPPGPAGSAGAALWSFGMSTAHGAGLMLVPALAPLCLSDVPAREITASGSLLLALAAVGVHTAAMLVVTGAVAAGVCRVLPTCLRGLAGLGVASRRSAGRTASASATSAAPVRRAATPPAAAAPQTRARWPAAPSSPRTSA